MIEREVERVAEFLAVHAVLLLGLIVLAAAAAFLAVAGAVRLLRRHRDDIRAGVAFVVHHARRFDVVDHAIVRSKDVVPSGYLVVHLLLGLALVTAIAVFLVLAEDVFGGGEIVAFDVAFARALRDQVSPGWERFFAGVSWLGTGQVIAAATAVLALVLVIKDNVLVAVGWIAAQGGGGVLNLALKEAYERTRPESADPLLAASSWSFPSGHAMGTFILCGLGCYLLLRDLRSWMAAGVVVTISLSWCVVMAFSRLYLGVHYASDVAAGTVAGMAWVAVCASAFEMIRRRGAREDGERRALSPSRTPGGPSADTRRSERRRISDTS
jgi:undecaprenyl-diphosphatase